MSDLPPLPNTRADVFERIYNYQGDVYNAQLFTPEMRTTVLNAILKSENGDDSDVDACLRMLCFAAEGRDQELIIKHLEAVADDPSEYSSHDINLQMAISMQEGQKNETRRIDVLTQEDIPSDREERLQILKNHFLKQEYKNWLIAFVNDPKVSDLELQVEITRIYAVFVNAKQDTSFIKALLQGHPVESAAIPDQFKEMTRLLMILLTAAEAKAAQIFAKRDRQFVEKAIWMQNILAAGVMTVAERAIFAKFVQATTPASEANNQKLQMFVAELRKMDALVEKSMIKFSASLGGKSIVDLIHIFIDQHELIKACKDKMYGENEADFDARLECAVFVQSVATLKPALLKSLANAKLTAPQYNSIKTQIESNRDLLGENYKFLRDVFAKLPEPEVSVDKKTGGDNSLPQSGLRLDV